MQFKAITSSLLTLLPLLTTASPAPLAPRQLLNGLLLGPITMPPLNANLQQINVTLINFNDEVFDISSISIFGNVTDGGCTEDASTVPEAAQSPGAQFTLGPISGGPLNFLVQSASVTLINFNDEVFDISSISIFGNVVDGVCPPAA